MKSNEKQTRKWRGKTSKKIALSVFIAMFKTYPVLFNLYLTALIVEWWCYSDKISPFIYPILGNCLFVIAMSFVGSYAFKLCNIYRIWILNAFIWVSYEWLDNLGVDIPNFLIAISATTSIVFLATFYLIIRQWRRKIKTAKT